MQKAIALLLLTLIMVVALVGCSNQDATPPQPTQSSTEQAADDIETNEYNQPSVDKLDSDFEVLSDW